MLRYVPRLSLYVVDKATQLVEQQDALFSFSLLQLITSTCFKHLFAHHREELYIQQFVYFVRIMSAGC
jgi:hypothetical protein